MTYSELEMTYGRERLQYNDMNELKLLRQRITELEASEIRLKRTESALKESEKRFRDVAENALEWIWEVDSRGKYIYASPVVEKILGYSSEEMLEKHFYDMFHPDERDELKKFAFDIFAKKEPFREFVNKNVRRNGRIIWLSTSGAPILDEKRELIGYRGADIDITDYKELEEKLRESERDMREFLRVTLSIRERDKKELAKNLHDEVGSISITLGACLSIAKEEIKGHNIQEALKSIGRAEDEFKKAVGNLRGIAAGLRPPSLDVIGLAGALEEYFSDIAKQIKIKIDFNADIDERGIDNGAATVLYRVAQEALTNIIRHAKAKKVKVKLCAKGSDIELSICDDGRGFDVEKVLQGIDGLGVRGMKESIEALAGRFAVKSTFGKGTRISTTLPNAGRRGL